ncbi:MAG: hypothetical protein OXF79_04165 [Chloroflexi bacterium]|nr:hypothetical protein [Chloroflexota bacterium]
MADRKNKRKYPYCPDYATPPGYVLLDHIEAQGLTPAEFARRHSLATDLIESIIAGNAPIDSTLAAIFGSEFRLDANFWLDIEADYRRRVERKAVADAASSD